MTHGTRSVLALACAAVFALAMLFCCTACVDTDADHCAETDAADSCAFQCACQGLSLPARAAEAPATFVGRSFRSLDAPLKLPRFAAAIFQPPRA
jgi:hypothetical protein